MRKKYMMQGGYMPYKALAAKRLQVVALVIIKRKLNLKIAYSYRLIFYAHFGRLFFLDHLFKALNNISAACRLKSGARRLFEVKNEILKLNRIFIKFIF